MAGSLWCEGVVCFYWRWHWPIIYGKILGFEQLNWQPWCCSITEQYSVASSRSAGLCSSTGISEAVEGCAHTKLGLDPVRKSFGINHMSMLSCGQGRPRCYLRQLLLHYVVAGWFTCGDQYWAKSSPRSLEPIRYRLTADGACPFGGNDAPVRSFPIGQITSEGARW